MNLTGFCLALISTLVVGIFLLEPMVSAIDYELTKYERNIPNGLQTELP